MCFYKNKVLTFLHAFYKTFRFDWQTFRIMVNKWFDFEEISHSWNPQETDLPERNEVGADPVA